MKANIQTVTGINIIRDINPAESPMGIIRKFYEEDETAASQIFASKTAIDQLMVDGNVDETRSAFELMGLDGASVRADWKTPLCNQPSIKEELAKIESEGQIPTFVVSVSSIVASAMYSIGGNHI